MTLHARTWMILFLAVVARLALPCHAIGLGGFGISYTMVTLALTFRGTKWLAIRTHNTTWSRYCLNGAHACPCLTSFKLGSRNWQPQVGCGCSERRAAYHCRREPSLWQPRSSETPVFLPSISAARGRRMLSLTATIKHYEASGMVLASNLAWEEEATSGGAARRGDARVFFLFYLTITN